MATFGTKLSAIVPVGGIGDISGSLLSANPAVTERGVTTMLLLIPQVCYIATTSNSRVQHAIYNFITEWQLVTKQAINNTQKSREQLDGSFVVARAFTLHVIFSQAVVDLYSFSKMLNMNTKQSTIDTWQKHSTS